METNFSAKEINRVQLSGSSLAETPGHGERLNSSPIISLRIWIEYKLDIYSFPLVYGLYYNNSYKPNEVLVQW